MTFPWYPMFCNSPPPLHHQVTLGGSAAQAGLQMGDVILEVNGYAVGGGNDLEKLQQLAEAEPPLCLKLAARSCQDSEAWNPPGSGEVRKKRQMDCEQPGKDRGSQRGGLQGGAVWGMQAGTWGHGRWGQKDPWN